MRPSCEVRPASFGAIQASYVARRPSLAVTYAFLAVAYLAIASWRDLEVGSLPEEDSLEDGSLAEADQADLA